MEMDDPTNFEILSSLQNVYHLARVQLECGESIENILTQEWYIKEEANYKSAIPLGRLKRNPLSYFVMTINMKGKSVGEGTAQNRRLLLTILLRNFPCSLIMSQEHTSNRTLTEIAQRFELEERHTETEAAVFWNRNEFQGTDEGLQSTDERIRQIRDDLQRQFNELDLNEILPRIKMVRLSRISEENEEGENLSFLAVSWHGPHSSMSISQKHNVFKSLQRFVKKVSEEEGNIPFIIGGDFNLNTLDEPPVLNDVVIPTYSPSPRGEKKSAQNRRYIPFKDNFLFSSSGIQMEWTRPLDFTSRSEQTRAASDLPIGEQNEVERIHVDRGNVDQLLDHDPVVGVLVLLPRSNARQSLNEQFQAL